VLAVNVGGMISAKTNTFSSLVRGWGEGKCESRYVEEIHAGCAVDSLPMGTLAAVGAEAVETVRGLWHCACGLLVTLSEHRVLFTLLVFWEAYEGLLCSSFP